MSDQTPKPPATCERCGKPVNVKSAKYRRCTRECRNEGRAIRAVWKLIPKTCDHCGKNFNALAAHGRFCSPECRRKAWNASSGYDARRAARIAALGGRCAIETCEEDGSFRRLYIHATDDGALLLCARHHTKRSQEKFWQRWPKSKKDYVKSLRLEKEKNFIECDIHSRTEQLVSQGE